MAVAFVSNPVQSELLVRMRVIADMAVILLSLGLRWPLKVFGLPIQQWKVLRCAKYWPLGKSCNRLRLSSQGCVKWCTGNQNVARIIDIFEGWQSAFLRFVFLIQE